MATEKDYQSLYDRIAALRETVTNRLSADLITNPQLADALNKQIDDMLQSVVDTDSKTPPPPDKGLAQLIGVATNTISRWETGTYQPTLDDPPFASIFTSPGLVPSLMLAVPGKR